MMYWRARLALILVGVVVYGAYAATNKAWAEVSGQATQAPRSDDALATPAPVNPRLSTVWDALENEARGVATTEKRLELITLLMELDVKKRHVDRKITSLRQTIELYNDTRVGVQESIASFRASVSTLVAAQESIPKYAENASTIAESIELVARAAIAAWHSRRTAWEPDLLRLEEAFGIAASDSKGLGPPVDAQQQQP